jgi:hypothetical protein
MFSALCPLPHWCSFGASSSSVAEYFPFPGFYLVMVVNAIPLFHSSKCSEQVLRVVFVVRDQVVCLHDVLQVLVFALDKVVLEFFDQCSLSVPVGAK